MHQSQSQKFFGICKRKVGLTNSHQSRGCSLIFFSLHFSNSPVTKSKILFLFLGVYLKRQDARNIVLKRSSDAQDLLNLLLCKISKLFLTFIVQLKDRELSIDVPFTLRTPRIYVSFIILFTAFFASNVLVTA